MLYQTNFYILSCYNDHGTMIFYNVVMFLSHTFSITNSGVGFIIIFFNENPWKELYIITIYKPPQKIFYSFIYLKI